MSTTIDIRLPDGAIKQMPVGSTPFDVAKDISEGLARAVLSASYNGATIESKTPLNEDGDLVLYTWNDAHGKRLFGIRVRMYSHKR
jgi:threonyl-tRNA synthetase